MGGTNNLEDDMFKELNQLEKIGSIPKFNMLVQFSRLSENGKATRYYVIKDDYLKKIDSKQLMLE